jgi:anti-anti-sigma factor
MDPACQIDIYSTDAGYLFRILGRGTRRESPAVRDFIFGALDDGADIVVDLNQCEHLDSTCLGCLVILTQQSEQTTGSFSLFADTATRQRLFGTSHLDRVLAFADGLPESNGPPVSLQITNLERREFCQHLVETHQKLAELGGPSAGTFQRIVDQLKHEMEQLLL